MQVTANGLRLEVEDSGGAGEPVLLLMGLGGQLIHWPPQITAPLAAAGYRVIRIDNRDAGLSQYLTELGRPNLAWHGLRLALGGRPKPPYTLADMAQDTIGVLDALGVARAHVVGMSMGGMIAQRMAIGWPERVGSLVSIMSSSGARGLPGLQPQVLKVLLAKPRSRDREAVIRYYLDFFRVVGSPTHPVPEAELRPFIEATIDRAYHPVGNLRQLAAVMADTGRAAELARISAPTLVLHGRDDPFVPLACGQDTARRIRGARFEAIDHMAHLLEPAVCDRLQPRLLAFLREHPLHASPVAKA
ncbi:alpha/beta hydrolase [Ottowia sp. SB7-C50]|uniref:alpha/beta fold hydrolase n=1 Tax=Ottowia sp. SB7-C50 TaxID=3081231 RepID=UPI002953BE58|nr:alpha/beta hydrolase [Ottowia sp. SB7-C50]WOP14730.1 alpha/beta hydrolase [Ottowia sp. SB7-C50]